MKILLAEDDKNLGRLLQNLLKKENIKTDWVEDGEAAYEQCYRDGYDVLILDWMMPKLDGIALCKRLRGCAWGGGNPARHDGGKTEELFMLCDTGDGGNRIRVYDMESGSERVLDGAVPCSEIVLAR